MTNRLGNETLVRTMIHRPSLSLREELGAVIFSKPKKKLVSEVTEGSVSVGTASMSVGTVNKHVQATLASWIRWWILCCRVQGCTGAHDSRFKYGPTTTHQRWIPTLW